MAVKICLRTWRARLDQNSLDDLSHFQKLIQIRRFLQIQVRSEFDGGGTIGGLRRRCQHDDGHRFEPRLAANVAQHGVPIMFGKVYVEYDQVGLPGWPLRRGSGCFVTEKRDGLLSIGGYHHVARQLATVQGFAEQQHVSGIVFRQ